MLAQASIAAAHYAMLLPVAGLQQSTIDKRPLPSSGWDNSAILQPDNAGVSILDGAAAGE